jgi:hypothetical protein
MGKADSCRSCLCSYCRNVTAWFRTTGAGYSLMSEKFIIELAAGSQRTRSYGERASIADRKIRLERQPKSIPVHLKTQMSSHLAGGPSISRRAWVSVKKS